MLRALFVSCRALIHHGRQCVTHSFYRWRIFTEQAILENEQDNLADTHRSGCLMKRVLKEWAEWARYKRRCKMGVVNAIRRQHASIRSFVLMKFRCVWTQ